MNDTYRPSIAQAYADRPRLQDILPQQALVELVQAPDFIKAVTAPDYQLVYLETGTAVQAWIARERTIAGKGIIEAVTIVSYDPRTRNVSTRAYTGNTPIVRRCETLKARVGSEKQQQDYETLAHVFEQARR